MREIDTGCIEQVPGGVEAEGGLGVRGDGGTTCVEGFGRLREGWPKCA